MNFRYPVDKVNISQGFGANSAYYARYGQLGHNGLDLSCTIGTPVYASEAGTIFYEGWGVNQPLMGSIAGVCVIIDHGTVETGYAHMSVTVISRGQKVTKGQIIGYSGATGTDAQGRSSVTGGHVHFEFIGKPVNINNGYYGRVNPSQYLISGTTAGATNMIDKATLTLLFKEFLGRVPDAGAITHYVGKYATSFVVSDLLNSAEHKTRVSNQLKATTALNAKVTALVKSVADLTSKLNEANKQIAVLKGQPTTSVVSDTPLAIESNSILKWIKEKLSSVFK